MKKKNNITEDEKYTFKEEVPEEALHSKIDVDDRIFVSRRRIYGLPVVKFLLVLLFISLLFALIFGFVSLNSGGEPNVTKYSLVVAHSNELYGGAIDSFSKYNNLDSAYSYQFTVKNSNDIDITYYVKLINNEYDFDNTDMSLIKYQLINDDTVVKEGQLKNSKDNELYKCKVSSNSADKYVLKLWSTSADNLKLNFKITVGV